ncbi:MAG: beta-ketoacyl-[acyl-carrier-protein] synthase family protein, partial [Pseudomonadota bacterium]
KTVQYVNAHATSTILGDIQEAQAIGETFSHRPPVSSLKGHFGHSLAACGTIEAICCIEMMNSGIVIANRNLKELDPECASIYALKQNQEGRFDLVVSNNFAFGGMNTSFILKSCR